ncbi:MAG: hypothetical protein K8R02_07690 [Anaerohalosphaeraceae bacterium]|nr:hypothetical protein [Anaerohalosphaeraceae bacterium]
MIAKVSITTRWNLIIEAIPKPLFLALAMLWMVFIMVFGKNYNISQR